ncbi:ABC transporter substrate-binding protein [Roseateles amylovorans]|uniref:Extracellular solute-binding protein n=1 Tax=Roseateles amylovorans TaxID=2978473 RepID=A0ABY6B738_9BURK|nr:extracellular solute-binding protein [Roseateles amylovorans]UXH80749.1 extracellular solute-binding protein [Roseateles amylovorans]
MALPALSGFTAQAATQAATPAVAAPAEPTDVLTVAAFPLVDDIARAAMADWRRLHPQVELRVLTRQYSDHHTAMTTALSTAVGLPDVMALESSVVGRFAQGGGLDDLRRPPYGIEAYRQQLVPFAYDQAVARDGSVVAMPTDIGPGTMLYRHDILARAEVVEDDLTRSWDAYIAAGQRLKARTGAYLISSVQTIKDIMIRDGLNTGEGLYFDTDSRVLVNSPRFERAFELALRARQLGLDAKVSNWSNDWGAGLKQGRLATELSAAWLVGQLSSFVAPSTRGLWRAAPLPGGAQAAYGGAFYAIARKSAPSRKALAWDFIRLMTLDPARQLQAFKTHDAFPALRDVHADPFFSEPVDFLGGQRARLLWRDAALRITAMPVHKQNQFAEEVVQTELDKVLRNQKTIKQALADAEALLARRARR